MSENSDIENCCISKAKSVKRRRIFVDSSTEEAEAEEHNNNKEEGNTTPKKKRAIRHELTKSEKCSRKQRFSSKWLDEEIFKNWLQTVEEDNTKSKCNACNAILSTKRSDLIKHSKSIKHINAMKAIKNSTKITQFCAPNNMMAMERQKIMRADIKYALLVAAHNFSFNAVSHCVEMAKMCFHDSAIATTLTQKRTKCTSIVKDVLSATIKDNLKLELKDKYISVLLDESTDISNNRVLCILVRYISNNKIKIELLDILKIEADEGTAAGLYSLFKKCLSEFSIDTKNIVGYCSDNASVMMGKNESFKTHLLKDNPDVIVNGCICHSAHLVAAAASDMIPNNIEALLQNLYSYFSRSPKRQFILEEFQAYMKVSKCKILSPSKTRWLVLLNCVNRVLEQWEVLTQLFRVSTLEKKNPLASIIYQELQNPYVKAYLNFFKYILPIFNKFNAFFQSANILLDQLYSASTKFIKLLCSNFIKHECLNNLKTLNVYDPHVLLSIEDIDVGPGTTNILKDLNKTDNDQFKLRCLQFYQKAAHDAFKRFPINDEFYENLKFLEPSNVLDSNCKLDAVLKKYKNLDDDGVYRELKEMKLIFSHDEKETYRTMNKIKFWESMRQLKTFNDEPIFPNLTNLAAKLLTIPHGNADVERVFSLLVDVKTKKRNRLSTDTVSALLRIKLDMFNKKLCCLTYEVNDAHYEKYKNNMYSSMKEQKNQKDINIVQVGFDEGTDTDSD